MDKKEQCQRCGRTADKVFRLFVAPTASFCSNCVLEAANLLLARLGRAPEKTEAYKPGKHENVHCDICKRSIDAVGKLVRFPGLNICSECVFTGVGELLRETNTGDKVISTDRVQ